MGELWRIDLWSRGMSLVMVWSSGDGCLVVVCRYISRASSLISSRNSWNTLSEDSIQIR